MLAGDSDFGRCETRYNFVGVVDNPVQISVVFFGGKLSKKLERATLRFEAQQCPGRSVYRVVRIKIDYLALVIMDQAKRVLDSTVGMPVHDYLNHVCSFC